MVHYARLKITLDLVITMWLECTGRNQKVLERYSNRKSGG